MGKQKKLGDVHIVEVFYDQKQGGRIERIRGGGMIMKQDGVSVYCLPDGAVCKMSYDKVSPLELDECPMRYEECTGDCMFYTEE